MITRRCGIFRTIALIVAFVVTSASSPSACVAQEGETASLEQELDQQLSALREGLVDAFKKRDISAMLTFVTSDVVVTWQNGEVSRGKDQLRAFIERMMVGPQSVVSEVDGAPTVEGRKIYDGQIISFGHMNDSFTLRDTGQKLPFDSRFSALIVRQEGRLLLSGLHLSVNAFENPILSGAVAVYKTGALVGAFVALILGFILGRRFGRGK